MIKKYVQVSRYENGELLGSYTEELDKQNLFDVIDGEYDSINEQEVGTKIELEIIEMEEEIYNNLPEFAGY